MRKGVQLTALLLSAVLSFSFLTGTSSYALLTDSTNTTKTVRSAKFDFSTEFSIENTFVDYKIVIPELSVSYENDSSSDTLSVLDLVFSYEGSTPESNVVVYDGNLSDDEILADTDYSQALETEYDGSVLKLSSSNVLDETEYKTESFKIVFKELTDDILNITAVNTHKQNIYEYVGFKDEATFDCSIKTIPQYFTYTHTSKSFTVTGLTALGEAESDLVIPSTVAGLPVKTIAESAFEDETQIKSITIPDSVKTINYAAFRGCTGLISFDFPDSVTYLNNFVLANCTNLESVTLGSDTYSIGGYAFDGCENLDFVSMPDTVEVIGACAFRDCNSLGYISLSDSLEEIQQSAFSGCSGLTSITLPDSLTTLGEEAFTDCTSLSYINIPTGISTISSGVFCNCSSLTSISIPNTIDSIENSAFQYSGLSGNVSIPNSVTNIGSYAFYGCSDITSINVPYRVSIISSNAFSACTSLTDIEIAEGVQEIEASAFSMCNGLQSIYIPSSVTYINEGAFAYCNNLAEINIENTKDAISGSPWGANYATVVWLLEPAVVEAPVEETPVIEDVTPEGEEVLPETVE